MLGTLVNFIAIILGSLIGFFIGKNVKEKYNETIIKALGLTTIIIGIDNGLKSNNMLIVVGSIAVGSFIGELIDIEGTLENFGKKIESRIKTKNPIAEGFFTSTLLFCTGSMSILGAIQGGLLGNHETLFVKAFLDGVISIFFTASLGIGVIFASFSVLIYQGAIALFAGFFQEVFTDFVIMDMSSVGGIILVGLGLNIIGATKLRVGNMIPGLFLPIIIYPIINLVL